MLHKVDSKQLEDESVFLDLFNRIEQTNRHLFVTGKAGTGKSTFLTYLKRHTKKNCAVVAPTGVAALNVSGQTIHSFFKFKPRMMDAQEIKPVTQNKKLYSELQLLIIDEISMVRADVFDGIEQFLRINGPCPGQLFGGVQLCVIGDLFQLPPIVAYNERQIYEQRYASPFFFSSKAYANSAFQVVELDKVYRQHDGDFIGLLNRLRIGKVTADDLTLLNQRYGGQVEQSEDRIVLTTTNALADTTNESHLAKLEGELVCYEAKMEGEFAHQDDKLPAPQQLKLKIGAQVMFTRNDSKKRWVNGTIGIVTQLNDRSVEVQVKRQGRRHHHILEREEWENIRYEYDTEQLTIKEKVVGVYKQYPLVHAWAITIHKSQGKTLDSIEVDLGRGAFVSGQLYVALSRCPSLEGIALRQKVTWSDVRCHPVILSFYRQIWECSVDSERVLSTN